jgi:hypothetical protein
LKNLSCKYCKRYWEDLKYCPYKNIFLPTKICEDFSEKEYEEDYEFENVRKGRKIV